MYQYFIFKNKLKGISILMKDIYFQLIVLNVVCKYLGCIDMVGKVNIVMCIEIKKYIFFFGKY